MKLEWLKPIKVFELISLPSTTSLYISYFWFKKGQEKKNEKYSLTASLVSAKK